MDDNDRMMQMLTGYWVTQVVHAAATFSLADHLASGPATAADIAKAEGTDVLGTFRLLRACTSLGLLVYEGESRFAATPLLDTLRKDNPQGLLGFALTFPAPGHWLPWGRFTEAVRTGQSQAIAALGMDVWNYFATQPVEGAAFISAMTNATAGVAEEAARAIDTSAVNVAVDIGGAGGEFLCALLQVNPNLRGVVFDRPQVAAQATVTVAKSGFQERLTAVGGDFFESVPEADLYLLKHILHDWEDGDCMRILENCRRAMRPGGRMIVIDIVLGEIGEPGPAALIDLTMMVLLSGRERSLSEFQELFRLAGFRITNIIPTSSPASIIEAVVS